MSLDELVCAEHGWFPHVGIHEAGHAAAAVLLGFDFIEVSIVPGHGVYEQLVLGQQATGGGLLMTEDDPKAWAGARPEDALVLITAGSLAERKMFGHWLNGGFEGDLDIWRRGTSRTEAQESAEAKALISTGVSNASRLLKDHWSAVLAVYGLFTNQVPHVGGRHLGFDDRLVVPYDAVRAAVEAAE